MFFEQSSKFYLPVILGALSWIIIITIGYISFTYFNDSRWALLLSPIIFSPIIFAERLGSSFDRVFLPSVLWLALGGSLAWLKSSTTIFI